MEEKQGTPHRPEPFTTVQGYQDHGFTAEIDEDGWVNVGPTQRSTLAALEYLKVQGCKKVGLMLNVIPEREAYEYIPVMCTAEPADLARSIAKLDFEKLSRRPRLFFKFYDDHFGAFINYEG